MKWHALLFRCFFQAKKGSDVSEKVSPRLVHDIWRRRVARPDVLCRGEAVVRRILRGHGPESGAGGVSLYHVCRPPPGFRVLWPKQCLRPGQTTGRPTSPPTRLPPPGHREPPAP